MNYVKQQAIKSNIRSNHAPPYITQEPIELLLPRLNKVRQVHPDQWIACCPVHDDHSPSMSIKRLPDGALLVYCRACLAKGEEIMPAVGLTVKDLYPRRPAYSSRKARGRSRPPLLQNPGSALAALHFEALVVVFILNGVLQGEGFTEDKRVRLTQALTRFKAAEKYCEVSYG